MDISELAAFLATLLPYLIKGGIEAGKAAAGELGKKITSETWDGLKKLAEKIHAKAKQKPGAAEAIAKAEAKPDDPRARGAVEMYLEELLQENPDLLTEAAQVVGPIVAANGSVVAGKIENSAVVTGSGNLTAINGSQIIQNYFQHNPRANRQELQQQVVKYLQWMEEYFGVIELRGIEQGESPVIRLALNEVYVPLEALFQPDIDKDWAEESLHSSRQKQQARSASQSERVALNQILPLGSRLIITGGPGCGKTTVLQHIAWSLAKSWLENSNLATRNLGIEPPYPLPIYVPLNLYAVHLRQHREGPAKVRTLAYFISEYLVQNQTNLDIDSDFFAFLLREGYGVILLLDGLDEVPTEDERVLVREDIEKLVAGKENLRIVVTSRTVAYSGEAVFGRGFRHIRVLPLEWDHIKALIWRAYDCRFPKSPERAHREAQSLLDGIQRLEKERKRLLGEDVEPLVDSPLMVRMLLIVAANERVLPNQRADLYQKTVDAMLRAENVLDKKVALEISRRVGGGIAIHREMLQYLAFGMHQRGEQSKEIDEETLKTLLKDSPHAAYTRDLIELTRQRGTVLDFRGGYYRFFHLSFQEFLVARYLADNLRDIEKIAQFLENGPLVDSWWREPVLLLCGYLDMNVNSQASLLLRRLAGLEPGASICQKDVDLQLVAAELAGAAVLECQYQPADLKKQIAVRLANLIEDKASTKPAWRARAGDTLSALGDPRFTEYRFHSPLPSGEGLGVRVILPATPTLGFILIPKGKFLMGSSERDKYADSDEKPQHELDLPYDYWIAKYPLTVAQWRAFVEASGYRDFDQRALHDPDNRPVRYVTWHNALAYCAWLDAVLKEQASKIRPQDEAASAFWQALASGKYRLTLPSEAEWEKAARGPLTPSPRPEGHPPSPLPVGEGKGGRGVGVRVYPWGDTFDPNKANTKETGIGTTTAVGAFPLGASPYGCLDMSGNVWEWTRTIWNDKFGYPYKLNDSREDLKQRDRYRVARGGSFSYDRRLARCASRGGDLPGLLYGAQGLRVVVSPIVKSEL